MEGRRHILGEQSLGTLEAARRWQWAWGGGWGGGLGEMGRGGESYCRYVPH